MIIGQFTWRGWEIEADRIASPLAGEVIWLNRTGPTLTGMGVIRYGRLDLTVFAPDDDLAPLELRHAFDQFRAGVTR
ncbi:MULTISPECIES: hypothetical protein [Glycomyces]|uniref:Uncharacterized protein n=2 Tax=Glycomyces TaxID=58113 RepID=A0A9X3PJW3_9ACTN|nr:hypothetical protein [Glycomyces lechevalierae]MDA1386605.1 hypothetical protein [Glycomyces lechevalierae]MDR7340673.1 hypothetical protein [Glycomyces lechevalierae]